MFISRLQGPQRKHCFQEFFYCCVTQMSHAPSREHLFAGISLVRVTNLLPSNGATCYNAIMKLLLHVKWAISHLTHLLKKGSQYTVDSQCELLTSYCSHDYFDRRTLIEITVLLSEFNIFIFYVLGQ